MTLKIRVCCTLLWNGRTLVKGKAFAADRPVGHPLQAINVFQMREVDEIIFLDVTATKEGRRPDFKLIESLARECFVPLTVGGGVKSVDDVRDLLRAGADKVSIRSAATPQLCEDVASTYGRQVLVCCFEFGDSSDGGVSAAVAIDALSQWGVGEVLCQWRDGDGQMNGYHCPTVEWTARLNSVPVIASGGCGSYEHMAQAIDAGASAVAAGAMWLFTEQTPLEAKKYLAAKGYPVRL